jgi:ABC-type lipoprotein release transport system permease subunit
MEALLALKMNSNVFNIDKMWQIYKVVSYNSKYPSDKTELGKKMAHWLTLKTGDEWEMAIGSYYKDPNDRGSRAKSTIVRGVSNTEKQIFDIWDFIEENAVDEKGKDLHDRPHPANVKEEF